MMPLLEADTLISLALREDIGDGDITTSAIIQGTAGAAARLIAQQRLVWRASILCSGYSKNWTRK
jgi:nicotinate-nucleotide pyrophosphorylase